MKYRLRMLAATVAVALISIAVASVYIFHLGGVGSPGVSWMRVFEGTGIAAVAGVVLTLLVSTLIRRNLELARLKEKDETLATILDNLNEGVLATNLDGQVMFANPTARRLLDMENRGDPRNPEVLQELPAPWEDFDLREAVEHCAHERECSESMVRDGETFLRVNLKHMPAFDEHKGGVLVVMQDLSEGRRLEANQQRFLTNAAHELRTPPLEHRARC